MDTSIQRVLRLTDVVGEEKKTTWLRCTLSVPGGRSKDARKIAGRIRSGLLAAAFPVQSIRNRRQTRLELVELETALHH